VHSALTFLASTLGIRVPLTGGGVIHSVFARALNLSGSDTWLALQSPGLPPVAHGLEVSWPLRDLREHFAAGGTWGWQDGRLSVASRNGGEVIRVSTQHATMWRSPLRPGAADDKRIASRVLAASHACARLAGGRSVFWGDVSDHPPPSVHRARQGLRALRQACAADEIDAAVRVLIGLGPGLTPAGDDAVIGWLAGMMLLPPDRLRDQLASEARRAVAECLPRTTDVSRAHLEDALSGEFSEALSRFANALAAHTFDVVSVRAALFELARVGASSGLDAAAGLLAALAAATRDPPARRRSHECSGLTWATEVTERLAGLGAISDQPHLAIPGRRRGTWDPGIKPECLLDSGMTPPPLRPQDAGEGWGGGKCLAIAPPSQPSPASGGRRNSPCSP
jgi:hypothetical protein